MIHPTKAWGSHDHARQTSLIGIHLLEDSLSVPVNTKNPSLTLRDAPQQNGDPHMETTTRPLNSTLAQCADGQRIRQKNTSGLLSSPTIVYERFNECQYTCRTCARFSFGSSGDCTDVSTRRRSPHRTADWRQSQPTVMRHPEATWDTLVMQGQTACREPAFPASRHAQEGEWRHSPSCCEG